MKFGNFVLLVVVVFISPSKKVNTTDRAYSIEALHNFHKKGQHSKVKRNISLEVHNTMTKIFFDIIKYDNNKNNEF